MSRVRATDTTPEIVVRRALHRMAYRFRLHSEHLPGRPDIVLPRHTTVIFVHGCFWHGHTCAKGRRPKSNQTFWDAKLDRNVERDREAYAQLAASGWEVGVIWECETKDADALQSRLSSMLGGAR